MSRVAVHVTELVPNALVAKPAGTAVDATNDHYVTGVPLEELVLRIINTTASSKTCTIVAGDSPPADASGQGDYGPTTFTAGDSVPVEKWFGPFTSARFVQAGAESGQLFIDFESGFTGTIEAFHMPRTA